MNSNFTELGLMHHSSLPHPVTVFPGSPQCKCSPSRFRNPLRNPAALFVGAIEWRRLRAAYANLAVNAEGKVAAVGRKHRSGPPLTTEADTFAASRPAAAVPAATTENPTLSSQSPPSSHQTPSTSEAGSAPKIIGSPGPTFLPGGHAA